MDVSRAQLYNLGDEIVIDDSATEWTVRVQMFAGGDRPAIQRLTVESRDVTRMPVTAAALAQIPVRQIASVAASAVIGGGDETRFRMLAVPRPDGHRSWPDDHFARVWQVAQWARRIGREGGEAGAVAEFWKVCPRTARRWIAQAARTYRSPAAEAQP